MPEESDEEQSRKKCRDFFLELFTAEEIRENIKRFSPEKIYDPISQKNDSQEQTTIAGKITSKNPSRFGKNRSVYDLIKIGDVRESSILAEIFYDIVGNHFLYEIEGSKPQSEESKEFRLSILKKAIEKKWFTEDTIIAQINRAQGTRKRIAQVEEVKDLKIPGPWTSVVFQLLNGYKQLPDEVFQAPISSTETKKPIETIEIGRAHV